MRAALQIVDGGEPEEIRPEDLTDDPRTDVEALCLCALMWSPAPAARRVTAQLRPADFHRPVYGDLYGRIAAAVEAGRSHEPAMILAEMTKTGTVAGHRGQLLARALTDVTLAGGSPEAGAEYAVAVLSAAYRRQFHAAASSMTQAAQELPQDQLYEHLTTIGWAAKAATERLERATAALSTGAR